MIITRAKIDYMIEKGYENSASFTEDNTLRFNHVANITGMDDSPFVKQKKAMTGKFVEENYFTAMVDGPLKDMDVIDRGIQMLDSKFSMMYSEIPAIQSSIVNHVNKTMSMIEALSIYSGIHNRFKNSVVESFDSSDALEENSLFVNTDEGVLTLKQESVEKAKIYNVSESGNGAFSPEYKKEFLFDGNLSTFAEYSNTIQAESLNLVLVAELVSPALANNITINLNNYGFENTVMIDSISTSENGVDYINIDADTEIYKAFVSAGVNIKTLVIEEGNNTDKKSFTFFPRKIKYVKVSLTQNTPNALTGNLKIGIKEVSVSSVGYSNTGSVQINKEIEPTDISSIAIKTNSNILRNTDIFGAKYYIGFGSVIDKEIFEISDIKKDILYVNQPWTDNNVQSTKKTDKIRLRVELINNLDNIKDIKNTIRVKKVSYAKYPFGQPYSFNIENKPIANTFSMYSMPYLRRSLARSTEFNMGIISQNTGYYEYKIPGIFGQNKEDMVVYAGKYMLHRAETQDSLYMCGMPAFFVNEQNNTLHVMLSSINNERLLGVHNETWLVRTPNMEVKTITQNEFMASVSGQYISIAMKHEVQTVENTKFDLKYYSDGIKENIIIKQIDTALGTSTIVDLIPANKTIIKLSETPSNNIDDIKETKLLGGHKVEFNNGVFEFENTSEYAFSIDYDRGILYLKNPYPEGISIQYKAVSGTVIPSSMYEIDDNMRTITVSDKIHDSNKTYQYLIEYNVLNKVDENLYELSDNKITLKAQAVSSIVNKDSEHAGKELMCVYKMNENIANTIPLIERLITPIVSNIEVIYTRNEQ